MKKGNRRKITDDLRPEYDLSKLRGGVRGKYAKRFRQGTNLVLKPISHTDKTARDIVEKFCGQFVWLLKVREIFAELFEDEQSEVLMEKTARSFFVYLGLIMHCYLLLEFAKITDPAKTHESENFTIENLIETIEWPPDILQKLKALRDEIKPFRNHILSARNKLCAHTDKETVLADRMLGKFPEGKDKEFLTTLQRFCDVIHKACFGEDFGQIIMAEQGDIEDFKKALEKAVAYDELLSESSGQEKARIFSYLHKVRQNLKSVKDEVRK